MSVSDNNDFGSSGNNSGKKDRRKRKILLASLAALALLSLFVLLGNPGLLIPDDSGREAEAIDNGANDGNETSQEEASPIEEVVEVQSNDTNSSGSEDSGSTSNNNGGSGGFVIIIDDGNGNGTTSSGGGRGGGGGGGGGGGSNDDDDDDDDGSTGGNTDVNHAPVATNQQISTDEDTPVMTNLTGSVTDSDGNPVTVSMVTSPSNGTVVLHANGSATYTPDNNYNGTDSFTYKANDGKADSNTANVTITILPVNDMPIAQNATLTTPEDTPIPIELVNSTVDVDGDVVEIIIVKLPVNGLVEIGNDNSTVIYTPLQDYHGQDSFEYMLSDTVYNSTVGTITIDVIAVNDLPVLTGELSYMVDEDKSLTMHILPLFTDVEAENMTITEITETQNGTLTLNENGTVTYTPMPDYYGEDSFDVTVSDGNEDGSVTETVSITVNPVNDAPVSNNVEVMTEEDVPVDIELLATDTEEEGLTFEIILPPSQGTLGDIGENGTVTYTPNPNYYGPDSFTFRASDGMSLSNIATVSIEITSVNDNPVANDNSFNINQDVVTSLDVLENDADVDGDTLTIVDVTQPVYGNVTINEAGDRVIYTPEAGNNLTDIFQYTITDGNDGYAMANVTVHIDTVNDAPTAHDVNEDTNEETPIEITLLATDPDAESTLTFAIISPPTNGVLSDFSASAGTVTYTPNLNFNGVDSFTFQVNDGIEDSNIATVTITILPVNDDPVAVEDAFEVAEDGTLNANVLDNDVDVDGDSLSTEEFGPQATDHGTVTMSTDGSFAYEPEADYNGPDSFQYTMTDGNGGFAIGTVSITVGSENDLPVANDDYAFTTMEAPVLIKVLLNDTDIDGDSLQVIQPTGGASSGTVVISNGGQAVIYTPNADFAGTDQFTYTVSDGNGGIATATVTVEVYPATFGHLQPPVGGSGTHEFEQGNTANVRFKLFDDAGQEIKDASVILMIQQVDSNNNPIGPVVEATSAGGSNDGNLFKYSNSFYQYNLKTDTMEAGKWALYVYLLDGEDQILMEDAPIDGISATILIK